MKTFYQVFPLTKEGYMLTVKIVEHKHTEDGWAARDYVQTEDGNVQWTNPTHYSVMTFGEGYLALVETKNKAKVPLFETWNSAYKYFNRENEKIQTKWREISKRMRAEERADRLASERVSRDMGIYTFTMH